ncbi:MAG TPA: putative peptidoglycan glycosyltransferase FtsW [Longimicrobiales bacterium]|nr:putative peptidoglycan glycosyltransferase FtsW [Longimicrobiales bacterium]
MAARPLDIAPAGPVTLPDAGLGRGWEPTAVVLLTLLLVAFGLVTLYSASSVLAWRQDLPDTYFVLRQAGGAAFGLVLLTVCALVPYERWSRWAWPMIWTSVALLILTVLPGTEAIAPEVNGARRWLRIAGIGIQPSELAKIAVIVWTATIAVKKQDHFRSLTMGLGPFFLVWGLVLLPVLLQPNLSTAMVIAALGLLVIFTAGARVAHFGFLALLILPFVRKQLEVGFRADRIEAFMNPAADPDGAGFQLLQSLVALGSGGVTGVGFGEGRQKFGFLPEAHNDFIFAMVGEEWGLVGVVLLVSTYLALILVGFRIAARAPDLFGELLAVGITSLIALQATLHMAVGLGLVPTTGVALPLFSYGRSGLLATLAALGILVSVARAAPGGRLARA